MQRVLILADVHRAEMAKALACYQTTQLAPGGVTSAVLSRVAADVIVIAAGERGLGVCFELGELVGAAPAQRLLVLPEWARTTPEAIEAVGATDHMVEPCAPEELAARVRLLMQIKALEDQLRALGPRDVPADRRLQMKMHHWAGMVHNLRNPLTVINGEAQMLAMRGVKRADRIVRTALRMQQMLNLALIDCHEQVRPRRELVDLNALLKEQIDLIGCWRKGGLRDVVIDLELGPLDPVSAHYVDLSQVFTNLIANAFEAMARVSQPRLSVATSQTADEIRVTVRDNGCGMLPDVAARVFEYYFSTRLERGRGVGLGYCQETIARYGGRIELETRPGAGATFVVHLPLEMAPVPDLYSP